MFVMRELEAESARMKVRGEITAPGHLIDASGAATSIAALKLRGLKRGAATLCIGGGPN
jgi:acetyl-CoA acetyltransferase